MNENIVTYEQFGAVGDGIANDFPAIYAAHIYANEHGLAVKADDTKTYRISDTRLDNEVRSVPIRTNVYWGDADFIIDDTELHVWDGTGMTEKNIFEIVSDYEPLRLEAPELLAKVAGLGPDTRQVELGLGYPALIVPMDESDRVYKRRGASYSHAGSIKHEVLLLDGEGKIDTDTPVMFTYDRLTCIMVYRTDIPHLVIEGGTFITAAPSDNIFTYDSKGNYVIKLEYITRGIVVKRSYTTVRNVKHYVVNEVSVQKELESNYRYGGAHYRGFFNAETATDVSFVNCVLTGKRCYRTPEGLSNYNGTMGTYEFSADSVNKIRLIGCVQSNFRVNKYTAAPAQEGDLDAVFSMSFIADREKDNAMLCWGVGGTNFCKNMEYIRCCISRFDAHCGLYNGKIIDCTINAICAVGEGSLTIENSRFLSPGAGLVNNSFIYLRDDYGATWDGEILVKDCIAETKEKYLCMLNVTWGNWDYGYRCYLPNLVIDNFVLKAEPETKLEIVNRRDIATNPDMHLPILMDGSKNINPVVPAQYLHLINNDSKQVFHLIDSPVFESTEITGNIVKD